mmetsp:Transcript_66602/g.157208  ORF Transcript_66602/g.157208 Transcript_66602/m.157208 type:complete len:95 (+) Transcript_66602:245-529(+)
MLRRTSCPRSPGGTPLRFGAAKRAPANQTEMISEALKKKFQNVRLSYATRRSTVGGDDEDWDSDEEVEEFEKLVKTQQGGWAQLGDKENTEVNA